MVEWKHIGEKECVQMKKRILTLLLTICIICTLVPFGALAEDAVIASGTCGTLTAWDIQKEGVLTISGTGEVTSAPWLQNYAGSIKSVDVGKGITTLCKNAFKDCTKLTSVRMVNDEIESIPEGAFSGCTALTTITLPAGLKSIGKSAFSSCAKLTTVNLPDGIESIGEEAFKGCANLGGLCIPASVTSIGKDAFSGCSALTDVAFGGTEEQWKSIGYSFDSADVHVHYNLTSFDDHFTAKETKPTCTEKGYTTFTCSCGYSKVEYGDDALGHDTELKNVKEATCSEKGYSGDKVCKTCGEIVEKGKDIATLDHKTELKNVREATCTVGGYSGDKVCKDCGEVVEKGSNTSPLGHDFKNGKCTRCGLESAVIAENPFVDVKDSKAYYYNPVFWAYYSKPQIAKGVDKTHFEPNGDCTRAQIVTFLWRANGEPKPTNVKNTFVDVSKDAYYYNAVMWAIERGVTNGVDETHFAPDKTCSRAEAVTFLWRADSKPDAASTACPFKDVSKEAFYYYAMLWAVGKDITKGVDATHFAPTAVCSRAQIVTFLYRDMT